MALDRSVGLGGKVARVLTPQDATEAMRQAQTTVAGLMVMEQEAGRGNLEAAAWLRTHAEVLRRLLGIT